MNLEGVKLWQHFSGLLPKSKIRGLRNLPLKKSYNFDTVKLSWSQKVNKSSVNRLWATGRFDLIHHEYNVRTIGNNKKNGKTEGIIPYYYVQCNSLFRDMVSWD